MTEIRTDWRGEAKFVLLGVGSLLLAIAVWWGGSYLFDPYRVPIEAITVVIGIGLAGLVVAVAILKVRRRAFTIHDAWRIPVILFVAVLLGYGIVIGAPHGINAVLGIVIMFGLLTIIPAALWTLFWPVAAYFFWRKPLASETPAVGGTSS